MPETKVNTRKWSRISVVSTQIQTVGELKSQLDKLFFKHWRDDAKIMFDVTVKFAPDNTCCANGAFGVKHQCQKQPTK